MGWEPTRRSLHGVAELLLAGPQHRATGRTYADVAAEAGIEAGEPAGVYSGGRVSDRTSRSPSTPTR